MRGYPCHAVQILETAQAIYPWLMNEAEDAIGRDKFNCTQESPDYLLNPFPFTKCETVKMPEDLKAQVGGYVTLLGENSSFANCDLQEGEGSNADGW